VSRDGKADDRPCPATWTANRQAQLTEARAASPAQRLAWLEEAIELVAVARRSKTRELGASSGGGPAATPD
jgi:hypothetical protein